MQLGPRVDDVIQKKTIPTLIMTSPTKTQNFPKFLDPN